MPACSYQLVIALDAPVRCRIGALGMQAFPAGRYVYTGSARTRLAARIERHLARMKRLHWHIDYLLAQPEARVVHIRTSRIAECRLNQACRGTIPVPGFGSSDCRLGCGSHLKFCGTAQADR